ncbi:hypothetical protein [Enterococcus sp. BWR-S5]|uniref:hypothetical protein n=1 Tax=Enterococcus sp. BWR-S5 TaxID=2787714 RepID=UPI001924B3AD|nr:hypothetical protein [Enterococcus sp. BWR-S5]MBL1225808.1 hypothetical protein [Enterococcus sp. BWR-S5]
MIKSVTKTSIIWKALALLGALFMFVGTFGAEAEAAEKSTRGISVYERGVLNLTGDTQQWGVGYYGPANARGVLNLEYYAQYGFGVGIADQTYYTVKLPDEFASISAMPEFKQAITGLYRQKATGITLKRYEYMQQDIAIENNTVIFKNPKFSYIVETRIHVDVQIDLGAFINNTGVHIPRAVGANYRFMGTNIQNTNLLNWNIFNGTDADARTVTNVLDFMA